MATTIAKSVGKNGANVAADVKAVAALLNRAAAAAGRPAVRTDGVMDAAFIAAVEVFQLGTMKLTAPDGRIDPGGRTLAALDGAAAPAPASAPAATPAPAAASGPTITYSSGIPAEMRLVSDYALAVIRRALAQAGFSAGVITSTLRLPAQQAAIMYGNAVQDLNAQFALYAGAGDQVLEVFKAHRTGPREQVIGLMEAKIDALLDAGVRVSNHVVRLSDYKACNVIDIGVNSTRAAAGATFNMAKLTAAFNALAQQGYIRKFIDETAKTNSCWHVEIAPGAKPL